VTHCADDGECPGCPRTGVRYLSGLYSGKGRGFRYEP